MSFRKYGGINHSSTNNIVRSHYSNSDNIVVSEKVGLPNSKVLFQNHLDMSGNSILNIGCIYFEDGTVQCSASSTTVTSDYRIKENVEPIDSNSLIDLLNPVTYFNKVLKKQDMGFIAHELQEQFPFLVEGTKDGPLHQSVNYNGLIALLVKEIQDLKKKSEEQNRRLENILDQLEIK